MTNFQSINNVFLDIETIPSEDPWVREYVKEKTTPPGNIKKQESIDAWYAEKHSEAVEDAMSKCSFDGAMNHIVSICYAINDSDIVKLYIESTDKESAMLNKFMAEINKLTTGTVFVGHNITQFDLRVIRQRSMVLGVSRSKNIPWDAKPWEKNPYDTMMQWNGKDFTSQDKIARAFGIEGKGGMDGSQVYDYWKAGRFLEIADYCADDVEMVRKIYKKMEG
jgi:predicted PolB exonuclease-like 3'-5' exonuclease